MRMSLLTTFRRALFMHAEPQRAETTARFFKTGKGEYAEGDVFIGVTVPQIRTLIRAHEANFSIRDAEALLRSAIHEERLSAVLVLVAKFQKGDERLQKKIIDSYLANTRHINNWDLVDLSADKILGAWLVKNRRLGLLDRLARSKNMWERRISIVSTFWFIRNQHFKDTLRIAKLLLRDEHDLIHKAAGWMLREVGKRSLKTEEQFLKQHAHCMPRTMLRYAIERFPEKKRRGYLSR